MDNLRALAMLAGVVFHAALAHSVLMHGFWPTADIGNSVIVDVFAWFSHLFRMPLFFVVAGFFAALLVQKRGIGGMLGNRFARVLLPFIVFWPLVYLSMGWLITHAAANVENLSPLLKMIKPWLANPDRPATPPTLVHLWFLPYLMCFCVLVWVVTALEWNWPSRWFASMRVGVLAGIAPLLLVPALFAVPAPHPAPESLFPQWWALVFYGAYFAFGFLMFRQPSVVERIQPVMPWLLASAMVGYAAFFFLIQEKAHTPANPLVHLLKATLEAYVGCWLTLCSLVYGKCWLDRSNRFLRYIADASYWVYLIHLPVLFAIQFVLLDLQTHWTVKFAVSMTATLGIAFASYQVLVRNSVVGKFLHGTRNPRGGLARPVLDSRLIG
jgi:peptidoglycan/LPS O-acetylase OafA/YrhL